MKKKVIGQVIAIIVCFLANLYKHNETTVAILNSIVLGWSLFLIIKKNISWWWWPILGLIPLFSFDSKNILLPYWQIASLTLWTVIKNKKILFGLTAILLIYGTAMSCQYLNFPMEINKERTLMVNDRAEEIRKDHVNEATFLPFRIRKIIYGPGVVALKWIRNTASFWEVKNFSDTLGIGIILLALGLKKITRVEIIGMMIIFLMIGFGKTFDRFNGLYFSSPFWLWLISKGL